MTVALARIPHCAFEMNVPIGLYLACSAVHHGTTGLIFGKVLIGDSSPRQTLIDWQTRGDSPCIITR